MTKRRIYLDNAATSWPKPDSVYAAVDRYQRELGAPAGRSGYHEAAEVERLIGESRRFVAQLIGAENPHRVVFTCGCTDSLNMAIHGVLRRGDHVVTSVLEHNSVLRPLRFLEDAGVVSVTRVPCDENGVLTVDSVTNALRDETRLVALLHASNVTGAIQPIDQIASTLADRDTLLLVDAAQTAGHLPLDAKESKIDLLATSGHKGLLGPLGTGILYVSPRAEDAIASVRQGGTGTQSEDDRQPNDLPYKFESGNHNVPGIVGLGAGAAYLRTHPIADLRRHDIALVTRLVNGLNDLRDVTVYGPSDPEQKTGVVSVSVASYDPHEVASMLDSAYSIQVRSGLHCAPLMHKALGTIDRGGTVRFSISPFTTEEDIDTVIRAVGELVSAKT